MLIASNSATSSGYRSDPLYRRITRQEPSGHLGLHAGRVRHKHSPLVPQATPRGRLHQGCRSQRMTSPGPSEHGATSLRAFSCDPRILYVCTSEVRGKLWGCAKRISHGRPSPGRLLCPPPHTSQQQCAHAGVRRGASLARWRPRPGEFGGLSAPLRHSGARAACARPSWLSWCLPPFELLAQRPAGRRGARCRPAIRAQFAPF